MTPAPMENLVQWLRAQLDEDERIARTASHVLRDGAHWSLDDWHGREQPHSLIAQGTADQPVALGRFTADPVPTEQAEHIARHDPARVLAEVEAKRRLVEASNVDCPAACCLEHTFSGSCSMRWMGPAWEADGQRWVRDENASQVLAPPVTTEWALRLLALPYADRPGYRDDWRP